MYNVFWLYYINYFMIMNYMNYFQLFPSNWNNWYNSTTSPGCTPCHTVPSTLLAFIIYSGTIQIPTSWQTTQQAFSWRSQNEIAQAVLCWMLLVSPTGTACSFPRIHRCIWYVRANNWTEQNNPCVWLICAIPISRGEQLREKKYI